jgi:DNA-binding transcriptional ArsR family regulator
MQEIPDILTSSRWQLLKELAQEEQSATELADTLGTSVSNVTQQLKILEAYNIIISRKSVEKVVGKPKIIYSIKDDIVYAAMLKNGKAEKKIFKLEGFNGFLYNMIFTTGADDSFYILKFMLKHEELLKRCKACGFIKSSKDSVELFILTEHVDEIRARFSNLFIEDVNGKTKKIINWTHNEWEINDGLSRKDKYFLDMLWNVEILYDPNGLLAKTVNRRRSL